MGKKWRLLMQSVLLAVLFCFCLGGGVDDCFTSHIWFGYVPIKETIFNYYIPSHSGVMA